MPEENEDVIQTLFGPLGAAPGITGAIEIMDTGCVRL